MESLEGTYKNKHHNFSLKIVRNYPDLIDKFTFIRVEADGTESTLFEKSLQGETPESSTLWAEGLKLHHDNDFTWISIEDSPVIGYVSDYIRI